MRMVKNIGLILAGCVIVFSLLYFFYPNLYINGGWCNAAVYIDETYKGKLDENGHLQINIGREKKERTLRIVSKSGEVYTQILPARSEIYVSLSAVTKKNSRGIKE